MSLSQFSVVIPREGGVSSMPRRRCLILGSCDYWISVGAFMGGACADPVADDDDNGQA